MKEVGVVVVSSQSRPMRLPSCESGNARPHSVVSGVLPRWKGGVELAHDAKVIMVRLDH